jgi:hypothetical protein
VNFTSISFTIFHFSRDAPLLGLFFNFYSANALNRRPMVKVSLQYWTTTKSVVTALSLAASTGEITGPVKAPVNEKSN